MVAGTPASIEGTRREPVCYAASIKGRRLSDSGKSPVIRKAGDSGKAGVSLLISFELKGFVVVAGLMTVLHIAKFIRLDSTLNKSKFLSTFYIYPIVLECNPLFKITVPYPSLSQSMARLLPKNTE